MRKLLTVLGAAMTLLAVAPNSALALEKTAAIGDDGPDRWSAQSTCYLYYYNFCTGWVWVWSGWGPRDVIGACVTSCCPGGVISNLAVSWHYVRTAFPAGWGFTGTVDVRAANGSCCPTGPALASQTFFPAVGWNGYLWALNVPHTFVVSITLGPGASPANPIAFDTDHPAIGPTGPQACGFCYPLNRTTHSFYYGTPTAPLCPGSPFFDNVCNAELRWETGFNCANSVEDRSWGSIKALYH